jgi:tRNA pseudouridine38-40 synthase
VNALDQCVVLPGAKDFLLSSQPRLFRSFRFSLNSVLGPDVVVWQAAWLSNKFSFKEDVLWKDYRYRILNSRILDPRPQAPFFWIKKDLDLLRIQTELKSFVGEHDFSSFAKSSGKAVRNSKKGGVRKLIRFQMRVTPHESWPQAKWIEFDVRASGFLHKMVRNMVGTLVDLGMGRDLPSVSEILRQRKRLAAGRSAPAAALTLRETRIRKSRVEVFEG